jgi:hypothetical protein
MAEVFGIVGTAAQLASFCGGIWTLLQDIKTSKSTLQQLQQQIEELRTLSNVIIENKVFHTYGIQALVKSILDTVTAIDLTPLIRKHTIGRTWAFLTKKGYLLHIFEGHREE